MAQSTPGTQPATGQTPPAEAAADAGPAHPEHLQRLLEAFPDLTLPGLRNADGVASATVTAERLVETCRWLKEAAQPRFDQFVDICGVHWPERDLPFEVLYVFRSLSTNAMIRLSCFAGGKEPALPTLTALWPCANWPEREIFDMFGVSFDGHPELRRLLMPNDWEGHPLRKDFPLGEEPVEFNRPGMGGPTSSRLGAEHRASPSGQNT